MKVNGVITKAVEDAMQHGIEIEDATSGAFKTSKIKSMNFAPFLAYDILTNSEKLFFPIINYSVNTINSAT